MKPGTSFMGYTLSVMSHTLQAATIDALCIHVMLNMLKSCHTSVMVSVYWWDMLGTTIFSFSVRSLLWNSVVHLSTYEITLLLLRLIMKATQNLMTHRNIKTSQEYCISVDTLYDIYSKSHKISSQPWCALLSYGYIIRWWFMWNMLSYPVGLLHRPCCNL